MNRIFKINNLFLVENKTVLITGGSSGLGKMMVEGFLSNGANVAFCGRDPSKYLYLFKEFDYDKVLPVCADITVGADRKKLIDKTLNKFGKIDVLINNAGISPPRDSEEFENVIATNLRAVILLSEECLPYLSKEVDYGKIINISSSAGINPPAFKNYGYTTSKAGVIVFTKQFSKKAIEKRVIVNTIAPGFFETPMTSNAINRFKNKIIDNTSIKRLGKKEDIIGVSLFLASQASNYIVGQTIRLDGTIY